MKKWITICSLILMVAFAGCPGPVVPPNQYPYDPTFYNVPQYNAVLDPYIKSEMAAGNIPGLSIAIINKGRIEYSGGWGYAYKTSPTEEVKVNKNTQFYLADLSQAYVTVAAMQLDELGLVDVDVDINQYLPSGFGTIENPSWAGQPITLRMLVSNTSTIIDDTNINTYYTGQGGDSNMKLKDFLKLYFSQPASFTAYDITDKPGRVWNQSRIAVALAAYVIENVSGIGINEFCKAKLYDKLGVYNASFFLAELNQSMVALPHTNEFFATSGTPMVKLEHHGSPFYPGEQLRTTSEHAGRLLLGLINDGAYYQGRFLQKTTVQDMRNYAFPFQPVPQTTGLVERTFGGRTLLGFEANTTKRGFCNRMYYDKNTKIGVVILANGDNCSTQVDNIMEKIFTLVE